MPQPIYLDHNATTPILPEVSEAVSAAHRVAYANPASPHGPGRAARQILEQARRTIAGFLGANTTHVPVDRVIFTSGGTEANNLALLGISGRTPGRVIISAIEHPSVVGAAEELSRRGHHVCRLPVSEQGVVLVDRIGELITSDTRLVSVMLGNNETGVLQPVAELAGICAASGVPFHTDAVQVVGKRPVHFGQLGVSALSATAHKFHGPSGIGVLIVKPEVQLEPILFGGAQQLGIRPGTELTALAVGMQTALELWHQESGQRASRLAALRDRLESIIERDVPDTTVHGKDAPRLPHTSNISFSGLDRQALLMALDMAGVACSTGSACASGSRKPSPTLLAMGCSKPVVEGSIRISLGATTTLAEVNLAVSHICRVANDLRGRIGAAKSIMAPREQPGETV